jgi:ketosteroid isomerase-like protein
MGEHADSVRALFRAADRQDYEPWVEGATEDVQCIDEITRRWLRGKDELRDYVQQLRSMGVSDMHSTLTDMHETVAGDTALVTCMIKQDYRVE